MLGLGKFRRVAKYVTFVRMIFLSGEFVLVSSLHQGIVSEYKEHYGSTCCSSFCLESLALFVALREK